jgi:hypothetical protein
MHPVNAHPPTKRNCVLCHRFERMVTAETILCDRFGHNFPAVETECVFWEREPGADDESDPAFWREVMHRRNPPKPVQPLRPRTLEETRAIMGLNYRREPPFERHCAVGQARTMDAIDLEEEAEAIRVAMGPCS